MSVGNGGDLFTLEPGGNWTSHLVPLDAGDAIEVQPEFRLNYDDPGTRVTAKLLNSGDPRALQPGEMLFDVPTQGRTRLHIGADSIPGADWTVDFEGRLLAADFVPISSFMVDGISHGVGKTVLLYAPLTSSTVLTTGTGADEMLQGGRGNDTLAGLAGRDTLHGRDGDDDLQGGADADVIDGGSGNDTLSGGDGADFFLIWAGTGDTDRILDLSIGDMLDATLENRLLAGGSDPAALQEDEMVLGAPAGGVTRLYIGMDSIAGVDRVVELVGSFFETDFSRLSTLREGAVLRNSLLLYDPSERQPRALVGTADGDTLYGHAGDDSLAGLEGNDWLGGMEGNDTLAGGAGADSLEAGPGDNSLDGGEGDDFVHFLSAFEAFDVNLATGLASGHGFDTLVGIENVRGGDAATTRSSATRAATRWTAVTATTASWAATVATFWWGSSGTTRSRAAWATPR